MLKLYHAQIVDKERGERGAILRIAAMCPCRGGGCSNCGATPGLEIHYFDCKDVTLDKLFNQLFRINQGATS